MCVYFETQNNWEIHRIKWAGTEIISYHLIELSVNGNIFFVDAEIQIEEGNTIVNRYILGSVIETLKFINQKIIKNSKIALVSTRDSNEGDYAIFDLVEIIEAKDKADLICHILICKNGRRYIDSLFVNREEELTECKTIWTAPLRLDRLG